MRTRLNHRRTWENSVTPWARSGLYLQAFTLCWLATVAMVVGTVCDLVATCHSDPPPCAGEMEELRHSPILEGYPKAEPSKAAGHPSALKGRRYRARISLILVFASVWSVFFQSRYTRAMAEAAAQPFHFGRSRRRVRYRRTPADREYPEIPYRGGRRR